MLHLPSKAVFHLLAQSAFVKRLASKHGMRADDGFARRFIAGETIEETLGAATVIQDQGYLLTLDYLGESVRTSEAATTATREYLRLIDVISRAGIERNLSLKLTQLGLDVDRATCVDNLRRILGPAGEHGFFIRIDMEDSSHTQETVSIFETLWQQDYRQVGIVLRSYLRRSADDVTRILKLGARIRLVKGAYKEPRAVAYPSRRDVESHFLTLMKRLLDSGQYHAIATPRSPTRPSGVFRMTASSSRCSTASDATCRSRCAHAGTACASTCRLAASGSRISCAGWGSGPPTWPSSCAA